MAQQKKKPSNHEKEKLVHAQHKNIFMAKVRYWFTVFCGAEISKTIPQSIIETIYANRSPCFRIIPAEPFVVKSNVIKDVNAITSHSINNSSVTLERYGVAITIQDYNTVCLSMINYYALMKETDFPQAKAVKAAMDIFVNDEELHKVARDKFSVSLFSLVNLFCKLDKALYWIEYKQTITASGKGLEIIILLHEVVPQTIQVTINGSRRPVNPIGWSHITPGIRWLSIKPSVFSIENIFANVPLPVYAQAHTFDRLCERIDCIRPEVLHYNMYLSFFEPKVCYDSNHNYLIEFRIFGVKAGYFRVDIVEGVIVARTFLFVTNNGTPEGQKLEKNTKLQKLDKNYLAIDKLSTFMTSDIGNNDEIKKIFLDAGCQCLIELYVKFDIVCIKHPSQATTTLMLDYLGMGNTLIPEELCEEPVPQS